MKDYMQKYRQGKDKRRSVKQKANVKVNVDMLANTDTDTDTDTKYLLSQLLCDLILARNPKFKKPNLEAWAKDIDRMIRIDKRDPKDIEAVIKWCQADSFWQDNILSAGKLRKQYDQLYLKMGKKGNQGPQQGYIASALVQPHINELRKEDIKINPKHQERMAAINATLARMKA